MSSFLAIDVGTGTVIGLLVDSDGDQFTVRARARRRHSERAVDEGRVVDIDAAARTTRAVADELQERTRRDINIAHYSVPGRGLSTRTMESECSFSRPRTLTDDDWTELRSRPVHTGENEVVIDESLQGWYVDGEEVRNPRGQFGQSFQARWKRVTIDRREVENKRAVIEQAGLVPGQVVLEPRAAMRSAFESGETHSSTAVLDFGAGTIDAALLQEGRLDDFRTFLGGGDQLSRKIEEQLTVDFETAETLKTRLGRSSTLSYEDLTGVGRSIQPGELQKVLFPVLRDQLAPIRDWFGDRDPGAVVLAGGASQFPFLERLVSRTLDVDESHVVHRPPRLPDWIHDPDDQVGSVEDHTVAGVMILSARDEGRTYVNCEVNGDPVHRLLEDPDWSLGELAREMGHGAREPHPDSAIMVRVDGEWETFRHEQRLEPVFRVNGSEAEPDRVIRSGDRIRIDPPEAPRPVDVRARSVVPEGRLIVGHRDDSYSIHACLIDEQGERVSVDERLEDGHEYITRTEFSRDDVLQLLDKQGVELPDRILWEDGEGITDRETFELGELIVLHEALNPEEYPLSQLEELPEPPDRPISEPLC